jgi:hypothetical protein
MHFKKGYPIATQQQQLFYALQKGYFGAQLAKKGYFLATMYRLRLYIYIYIFNACKTPSDGLRRLRLGNSIEYAHSMQMLSSTQQQ